MYQRPCKPNLVLKINYFCILILSFILNSLLNIFFRKFKIFYCFFREKKHWRIISNNFWEWKNVNPLEKICSNTSDRRRRRRHRSGVAENSEPCGAAPAERFRGQHSNEARHPHDGRPPIKLTSESWRLHKWLCGASYITFITAIFIFIFHICIFCAVINQGVYG